MNLFFRPLVFIGVLGLFLSPASTLLAAEEDPALPPGLEDDTEAPSLPEGLGAGNEIDLPFLPEGLNGEADSPPELSKDAPSIPFGLTGFLEGRFGVRTQDDPHEKTASIGETRLRLAFEQSWQQVRLNFAGDFLYDPVLDEHDIDLEKGDGFIDLREANLLIRPGRVIDLKIGRQILTWGTGDLVFINDLFPKDWNAFFIGRDTDYLKAPSDALKAAFFSQIINLDIVYTPRFDPDRYIDGRRISFYNNALGRRSGRDAIVQAMTPNRWFEDDEVAWRFHRNMQNVEVALYGYRGYWKSPGGMDAASGKSIFPALSVYGLSARAAVWKGIGNMEGGYYDSEDDSNGDDPLIRNGEFRFLAGYERELVQNFTASLQYYLERMLDHDAYRDSLPAGTPQADENRHVLTLRLTQLLMNQDLSLSLFTYYSPSDRDAYLRPKAHYKIDDFWSVELAGNLFFGKDDHTFFGQFEKNMNTYVGVRYGF